MTQISDMPLLPDPERDAAFYADVPTKRLIAWVVDTVLTGLLALLIVPFTAFTAIFYFPFLFILVNMAYRIVTISRSSATPGMRFVSIEFRARDGLPFDTSTATLHTMGYIISAAMFFPQVISVVMMLTDPRGQGLTDKLLGTVAINRAARG